MYTRTTESSDRIVSVSEWRVKVVGWEGHPKQINTRKGSRGDGKRGKGLFDQSVNRAKELCFFCPFFFSSCLHM